MSLVNTIKQLQTRLSNTNRLSKFFLLPLIACLCSSAFMIKVATASSASFNTFPAGTVHVAAKKKKTSKNKTNLKKTFMKKAALKKKAKPSKQVVALKKEQKSMSYKQWSKTINK